ncbi:MAG: hypothetical protein IJ468_01660 [Lachnospiraceae bacterium]|nr:hypothetical protein [Lachnospiraceae bacterium]
MSLELSHMGHHVLRIIMKQDGILLGHFAGVEGLLWVGPISDITAGGISLIAVKVYWKRIFGKREVSAERVSMID